MQLGFDEIKPKRLTQGELGHLKETNLPPLRFLREFRAKEPQVKEGDKVDVSCLPLANMWMWLVPAKVKVLQVL